MRCRFALLGALSLVSIAPPYSVDRYFLSHPHHLLDFGFNSSSPYSNFTSCVRSLLLVSSYRLIIPIFSFVLSYTSSDVDKLCFTCCTIRPVYVSACAAHVSLLCCQSYTFVIRQLSRVFMCVNIHRPIFFQVFGSTWFTPVARCTGFYSCRSALRNTKAYHCFRPYTVVVPIWLAAL